MRMRRLLAAVAATATLLGGMAFGAASAQAAGETGGDDGTQNQNTPTSCLVQNPSNNKSITLHAADYNQLITAKGVDGAADTARTYKYVKLASYEMHKVGDDSSTQYQLSVKTVDSVKNAVKAALKAATANQAPSYSDTDTTDPMLWVALNLHSDTDLGRTAATTEVTVRKFVTELTKTDANSALTGFTEVQNPTLAPGTAVNGATPGTLTFSVDSAGLYLVVDETASDPVTLDGKLYYKSIPMLVGTKVENITGQTCLSNGSGEVYLKSTSDTKPTEMKDWSFTKVDASGKTLSGAEFVIKSNGKYGTYDADAKSWTWTADSVTDAVTKLTSGNDGKVTISGLTPENSPYMVEEYKVPDGYLQNVKPWFTLTVSSSDGALTFTPAAGNATGYLWGDLTYNQNGAWYVKNVNNITQLPMTGAAGTALFVVLACLLGGAAGVVHLRSRKAKAMLR